MTPGIPVDPTGLVATVQTDTTVKLDWIDNATNEAGYLVERSLDGGATWLPLTPTTAVIGSLPQVFSNLAQNSLTTTDATLSSNTTVSYRARPPAGRPPPRRPPSPRWGPRHWPA